MSIRNSRELIKIERKISKKSILLVTYIVIIFIAGIIFVPSYHVWGPENNIRDYSYVFIFNSVADRLEVNGFQVRYQIDYLKVFYTIGIITLIFVAFWKLFSLWDQEDIK